MPLALFILAFVDVRLKREQRDEEAGTKSDTSTQTVCHFRILLSMTYDFVRERWTTAGDCDGL